MLASEPWLSELLASIPLAGGGSALSSVEAWCSLADRLGKLEEQKAEVQGRIAGTPQPPRQQMFAARNEWLRVMGLCLDNLAMVEGHEKAIETLRGPVLRTAESAARRHAPRASSTPTAAPSSSGAGSPAQPAAPTPPPAAARAENQRS